MPTTTPPSSHRDLQPLNPLDIAIRCADRSIRGMGYPGFETQMLIWLTGRLDLDRLQRALARLSQRRPVVTAVLVEDAAKSSSHPYWRFQHSAAVLRVHQLPSAEPTAVFAQAAQLISEIGDLASRPPLRFHVLRLPDGNDVFLIQYSHVLMDKSATLQLLREIDQLSANDQSFDSPVWHEPRRMLHKQLMRFPLNQRRSASRAAVELQGRTLRGRAAILGTGEEDKPRQVKLRIATRDLAAILPAIQMRSAQVCGLPNPSLAILASAFRAIRELGPGARNAERHYIAGIGLDMKLHRVDRALLQNLLSVVPLFARPHDLNDREQLLRLLSDQMLDCLRRKIDWGVVRLVNGFQRKPRHMQWVVEHLLRWTYSLWYAYFGALESTGERFCGARIEAIRYVGPTWSPVGLSLLANSFQGRLFFQATYDPELIHDDLAHQFLDAVIEDLRQFVLN